MRTIRNKVLRPLPQEASATWANDLPRFATPLAASVLKGEYPVQSGH
jgi:hypothetical protein